MKTAIVTGASRGIGAETAKLLAQNGFAVVINYKQNKQLAQQVKDEILSLGFIAETFCADVTKFDECKALVEFTLNKFKSIDVLVNNAGVSQIKPLFDVSLDDYAYVMEGNFKSVFNMCKLVSDVMVSNKRGKIINVSSVWGEVGSSCESVYCASKGAVISFTKALAKELGPSNVNVNCVAPGFIDTDMNKGLDSDVVQQIVQETPLMRVGKPIDVANAILFLAEDKSSFITGQVLYTNGGWQI